MSNKNILKSAYVILLAMILPLLSVEVSKASTADPAAVQDVASQLAELEGQAVIVERSAGTLRNLSMSHNSMWESHVYYLRNLKEDINGMGLLFAKLEQMKPQASEDQQTAIENVRAHLVALAQRTTDAIELSRGGTGNLRQIPYQDAVADLYAQAQIVNQTLDTIVDYHDANDRLQKLEGSHDEPVI